MFLKPSCDLGGFGSGVWPFCARVVLCLIDFF